MSPIASLDGLAVNLDTNSFAFGDARVDLTRQQADLLYVVTAAHPRTVAYDVIIGRLWGMSEPEHPLNTVKVVACRLRKKLAACGFTLVAIKGRGMRIDGPEVRRNAA